MVVFMWRAMCESFAVQKLLAFNAAVNAMLQVPIHEED